MTKEIMAECLTDARILGAGSVEATATLAAVLYAERMRDAVTPKVWPPAKTWQQFSEAQPEATIRIGPSPYGEQRLTEAQVDDIHTQQVKSEAFVLRGKE